MQAKVFCNPGNCSATELHPQTPGHISVLTLSVCEHTHNQVSMCLLIWWQPSYRSGCVHLIITDLGRNVLNKPALWASPWRTETIGRRPWPKTRRIPWPVISITSTYRWQSNLFTKDLYLLLVLCPGCETTAQNSQIQNVQPLTALVSVAGRWVNCLCPL